MVAYGVGPMVRKISVSLSGEMDKVLQALSRETNLPKSRLIDTYLRENPVIRRKLSEYRVVEVLSCTLCNKELTAKDVRIDTPKYGTLCLECWSKRVGEFVEKNPVSDRESQTQG